MPGNTGKRYSEEQIVRILKEIAEGKPISEVSRKYGVTQNTVYRWKSRYGEMGSAELQRMKELESENARLKRIVAQQALDIDALKDVVSKNGKS